MRINVMRRGFLFVAEVFFEITGKVEYRSPPKTSPEAARNLAELWVRRQK